MDGNATVDDDAMSEASYVTALEEPLTEQFNDLVLAAPSNEPPPALAEFFPKAPTTFLSLPGELRNYVSENDERNVAPRLERKICSSSYSLM